MSRTPNYGPLLVTARLATPLAGDPPRLDSLMEWALSIHHPKGEPGYKVDRSLPPPEQGAIPIPIKRQTLGPWQIALCSDPILPVAEIETVEHVTRKLGVEHAGLLAPRERLVVSTTNTRLKSYRIPLRIRRVECVRWFAWGDRRSVLKLLQRDVASIGKKPSDGYGRVCAWEVERADEDRSWYAPTEHGLMLMRRLPVGPWLPAGLIGARRGFGAATTPYWHPARYTDIMDPC